MSKGTRVGGSRWLGADFVAAAVRLAVAVPILISASTGAPGVVVERRLLSDACVRDTTTNHFC